MSVLQCCPNCGTTITVNVPGADGPDGVDGVDGANGADGANGINAYTKVTDDPAFVIPIIGGSVVVNVEDSTWMVVGQIVIIGVAVDGDGNGPAHFIVVSLPSSTSVELEYLGLSGDLADGETILLGSTVSPSAAPSAVY